MGIPLLIMSLSNNQSEHVKIRDTLSANPPSHCPKCGSDMLYVSTTFFTTGPDGKMWVVPLPVCPKCDLKEDTARFVPGAEC